MAQGWKSKPGDVVVRRPRQERLRPVHIEVSPPRVQSRALNPTLILVYSFLGLIFVGTILLSLPFTHNGGGFTSPLVALFTATSAATVTGLTVVDTPTYWTLAGQAIIMVLMFVGGLGFMTTASFLILLSGQRVSLTQRLLIKESLGVNQFNDLAKITRRIVTWSVAIQVVGVVWLFAGFSALHKADMPFWHAIFQSVSAFNNAGFHSVPNSDSLSAYNGDLVIVGGIGILVLIGGIGYWPFADVFRHRRRMSLWSLNTKLVLTATAILLVLGALVFLVSEFDNPQTMGPMSIGLKGVTSVFHSIISRTAGFSTVNFGTTTQQTNFFFTALMFIGGGSASVAGGIKVNTLAVIFVAVFATMRGNNHPSVFGRELHAPQIRQAMTIGVLAFVFVSVMALALTLIEKEFAFINLLFETVSAFGTVGLSTGLTSELSTLSQLIVTALMFVGRIGPLAFVLALVKRGEGDTVNYAQEYVQMS